MKFSIDEFRRWSHKKVTLIGMSGVGKTHLASMLRQHDWFHYAGDYRIGTRYLDEPILDMIKTQAMQVPFLRDLLRNDWIYIRNNIKINDPGPVLSFVGKLGNPDLGGVELSDFHRRQAAYREGEIRAMYDVPGFIEKAKKIYGYQHFVNDVGGSLCELLDEPDVIDLLDKHTLMLYIRVTDQDEEDTLIRRAQDAPKPLYYRREFLETQLNEYLNINGLEYAAQIDPDNFTRWIFPRLFQSRIPRYNMLARRGYVVTSKEVAGVRDEQDFLTLLETAIARN